MHGNNPARCRSAIFSAQHLLPTHKGVSEMCRNAAGEIVQLVCAVVYVTHDWLFIYDWELHAAVFKDQT